MRSAHLFLTATIRPYVVTVLQKSQCGIHEGTLSK